MALAVTAVGPQRPVEKFDQKIFPLETFQFEFAPVVLVGDTVKIMRHGFRKGRMAYGAALPVFKARQAFSQVPRTGDLRIGPRNVEGAVVIRSAGDIFFPRLRKGRIDAVAIAKRLDHILREGLQYRF